MSDILDFIDKFKFKHREELEMVFMNGNCYYFAVILRERFNGDIYYLPILNHFVCKIGDLYYDVTGITTIDELPYKWDSFAEYDDIQHKRIIEDCVKLCSAKDRPSSGF